MAFVLAMAINKKVGKTGGFYHMVCRHGVRFVKELTTVYNIITITFYL